MNLTNKKKIMKMKEEKWGRRNNEFDKEKEIYVNERGNETLHEN